MPDTDTDRDLKELSLLFEISTKLSKSSDLKPILKSILQLVAEYLGISQCMISIRCRGRGEIAFEEAYGFSPGEQERHREVLLNSVVDSGRPALICHLSEEPLFLNMIGPMSRLKKPEVAFICVPIKLGAETFGGFFVARPSKQIDALQDEIRLLTIIASSISQAVHLRQQTQEEMQMIKEENRSLHHQLKNRYRPQTIVGTSKGMLNVYAHMEKLSKTNTAVCLIGESGVGKERIARAIHYGSNRASKSFIAVDCTAFVESHIEGELFGHNQGAFLSAVSARKGLFDAADKGTIFFHETGALPLSAQTKLVRVIREKTFERVGGSAPIAVDVRVIAATTKNLEALVYEGEVREDLYCHLSLFPLVVPPLRERKTDIMLLAEYFVEKYSKVHHKRIVSISASATDALMHYSWPGNVGELESCIERAVIISKDGVIQSYHFPHYLQNLKVGNAVQHTGRLKDIMGAMERAIIIEALKRSHGNMAKAARSLGITERMIGLRVVKFGIDHTKFK